jgi:hypothetical protein
VIRRPVGTRRLPARGSARQVKPQADAAAALEREKELYEEIGRLKMELEWLKKKAGQLER